jgi:hypothetical protein
MNCPYCLSIATKQQRKKTSLGYRTFCCSGCRRTFNERTATPFNYLAHGIRNEKLASEQRSKEHGASTYRQDEGRKGEKREKRKEYRSCLAKNVIHREQGAENRQRDPLDGRSQVEDELRRASAISSSDSQTQGLGKHG